jgi:hypothetical protein
MLAVNEVEKPSAPEENPPAPAARGRRRKVSPSRGHRKAPGVSRAFLFDALLFVLGVTLIGRSVVEWFDGHGHWFGPAFEFLTGVALIMVALGVTPTDD